MMIKFGCFGKMPKVLGNAYLLYTILLYEHLRAYFVINFVFHSINSVGLINTVDRKIYYILPLFSADNYSIP